jgi:hypothetical protein
MKESFGDCEATVLLRARVGFHSHLPYSDIFICGNRCESRGAETIRTCARIEPMMEDFLCFKKVLHIVIVNVV